MSQLGADGLSSSAIAEIEAKYNAERDKRLKDRPQGEAQFIDLTESDKFKHLLADPWIDSTDHTAIPASIDISQTIKYLIVGAGYSGLLFAVRLLDAGVKVEELAIIDPSGGYGGVWYWNRYPGLMCDIESWIYMPLLEETGYMPRHRYSYGPELRGQAERVADQYKLRGRTIFRQQAKEASWDASRKEWIVRTKFAGDKRDLDLTLHAKHFIMAGGQLTHPKMPTVGGLENFNGHMFHTSRWDYKYTGGSPDEVKPELTGLKDKRVAVIGTGATAVQVIPELAKHAKQLFVVQRTPSSVDVRNQHETDPEQWKKMASKQGWWRERNANFADVLHQKQPQPAVNMVADQWVKGNPAYCTAWGYDNTLTPDQVPGFVEQLHIGDIPRAERIRKRVDEIVQDKDTAQRLKHWYPTWCKRPCFHDDYLPAFNRPNVTLVDTGGYGIDKFTEKGLVVDGKEYEVDLIVLSTGYKAPGAFAGANPAARWDISITGRDGIDMDSAFKQEVATLHGLCRAGFPNLFFVGVVQASLSANQMFGNDAFARHIAYIITEGQRQAQTGDAVIEATKKAQDDWGDRVAALAVGTSGMTGCTPNYLNNEGDLDKALAMGPEAQAQVARAGVWGRGLNHYIETLSKWKNEGGLKGLDVTS